MRLCLQALAQGVQALAQLGHGVELFLRGQRGDPLPIGQKFERGARIGFLEEIERAAVRVTVGEFEIVRTDSGELVRPNALIRAAIVISSSSRAGA